MSSCSLTKSGVKHVKCHSIALLSSSNGHEALIAVVLRLVNLNDTPAHLANLVDLLASLANNGTDHIVRNIDLLSHWLAGHACLSGLLAMGRGMRLGLSVSCHVRSGVRSSTVALRLATAVLNRNSWVDRGTTVRGILLTVLRGGRSRVAAAVMVTGVILSSAVVAGCGHR